MYLEKPGAWAINFNFFIALYDITSHEDQFYDFGFFFLASLLAGLIVFAGFYLCSLSCFFFSLFEIAAIVPPCSSVNHGKWNCIPISSILHLVRAEKITFIFLLQVFKLYFHSSISSEHFSDGFVYAWVECAWYFTLRDSDRSAIAMSNESIANYVQSSATAQILMNSL